MTGSLPAWLGPQSPLELWPVAPVGDKRVRFAAAAPPTWSPLRYEAAGDQQTVRSSGPVPGEGLAVTLLTGASAGADIDTWLQVPMSAVGGLDPQALAHDGTAELLSWARSDDGGLAGHLEVDEALGYSGLARFSAEGERPELIRIYVLLARRGELAWKLGLALSSAVLPGADEDFVDANDHVRARACLGGLAFG